MKTSVIEVHDMLSVLSVMGVEERIGKVPGVESVTVNHAAKNATVRYDETRLDVADIRSAVRQSAYQSEAEAGPKPDGEPAHSATSGDGKESKTAPDAPSSAVAKPIAAEPKPASGSAEPAPSPPAANGHEDKKSHEEPPAAAADSAADQPDKPEPKPAPPETAAEPAK